MSTQDSIRHPAGAMTPIEIRQAGMRALIKELGAAGFIRFMQQYEPGRGDYTNERHAWLDDSSPGGILQEIRESPPSPNPSPEPSADPPETPEIMP